MLLREFNEIQKMNFWKLANNLVMVDGEVKDSEIKMLNEYKTELGLGDLKIESYSEELSDIIESMNLNRKQKKILMFELIGLAFTDDYYAESEKNYLMEIQRIIKMSDADVTIIGNYVNKVLKLYSELGEYINEWR